MQEFQSIPGLAGRLFGGAGAGGADLRRAHPAHAQQGPGTRCGGGVSPAAPPEAVKCPRCESTNTKFCYYNNYNLSQPRHFCKSCRRYWTKGGVLRNVPVGGGCRKAKRSSSSSASSAPSTPTSDAAASSKHPRRASASSPSSNSNSNSGNASPAAAVTATTMPTHPIPAPTTPSSNSNSVAAFTTSSHHHSHSHSNPFSTTIDMVAPPPAPIFADQAAALASLFAPPPPPPLPVFSFAAAQQLKEEEAPPTPSKLQLHGQQPPSSSVVSEADMAPFASLDAAGIFELGDAASAAAYWNAGSCWTDVHDPSMYLP